MATITARILQSFGLNSGRAAIASRELGVTADTEQPVIGTTVGGAKYLGTEDYVTISTASPAAIALIRRSFVEYLCDTVGAGADIALDIRAGAQNVGYRLKVYALGATAYKVRVQYDTGVYSDVPAGTATEFVWNGTKWAPNQAASAATAATLETARTLNGVSFNGSSDIVVTKPRGTAVGVLTTGQLYTLLSSWATLSDSLITGALRDTTTGDISFPSYFHRSGASEIELHGFIVNGASVFPLLYLVPGGTNTFLCHLAW